MNNSFRDICHRTAVEATNKSLPTLNGEQVNKSSLQKSPAKKIRHHLRVVANETTNIEVAAANGVSAVTMCQWIAGSKNIPDYRQLAILRNTSFFLNQKIKKMQSAKNSIDEYLEFLETMQFGEARHD